MKVKVTVSVDENLAAKAKAKARREKRSLSSVVEQGLRTADISQPPAASHRIDGWVGKFSLPQRDPEDPRLNALLDKYEQADHR